jgi:hypothetical protein
VAVFAGTLGAGTLLGSIESAVSFVQVRCDMR